MRITLNIIAAYQAASSLAFIYYLIFSWIDLDKYIIAVLIILVLVNAAAAIGLWYDHRWSTLLSVTNLSIQIFGFNSSAFSFWYKGFGDLYLFAKIDPSSATYLVGPFISFFPGTFGVYFGIDFQGFEIYVGLLAVQPTSVYRRIAGLFYLSICRPVFD